MSSTSATLDRAEMLGVFGASTFVCLGKFFWGELPNGFAR